MPVIAYLNRKTLPGLRDLALRPPLKSELMKSRYPICREFESRHATLGPSPSLACSSVGRAIDKHGSSLLAHSFLSGRASPPRMHDGNLNAF